MQFLADESCDALIVRTLRAAGHDVPYIAEFAPGATDEAAPVQARHEQRLLLTEDRDFCELVFRDAMSTYGIVLVRIPAPQRNRKADRITTLVNTRAEQLLNAMVTLTVRNIRVRPLDE